MAPSLFLLLILERGRGMGERERRKETEREKHQFVVLLIHAFNGWFLYVPWPGIKPSTLAFGDHPLSNWLPSQGQWLPLFTSKTIWPHWWFITLSCCWTWLSPMDLKLLQGREHWPPLFLWHLGWPCTHNRKYTMYCFSCCRISEKGSVEKRFRFPPAF